MKIMRFLLFLVALSPGFFALLASADTVDEAERETIARVTKNAEGIEHCFPQGIENARAHLIYFRDRKSRREPVKVRVRVEKTSEPVLLALTAYRSVIWQVDAAEDASIAGVHLSGKVEQFVTGLKADVPVGRSFGNTLDGDEFRCASPTDDLRKVDSEARRKIREERSELRNSFRAELQAMAVSRQSQRLLSRLRERLKAKGSSQNVISEIDAMIGEEKAFVFFSNNELSTDRDRLQQYNKLLKMVPRRVSFYFHRPSEVEAYQEFLDGYGRFPIVSLQFPSDLVRGGFEVNQESITNYAVRRIEGANALSELRLPIFAKFPKSAERLPSEPGSRADSLLYLLERGYLGQTALARDYVCARHRALTLLSGFPADKGCPNRLWGEYTILGPVSLDREMCKGAAFYLPPHVPYPRKQNGCRVIELACVGLTASQCRLKRHR